MSMQDMKCPACGDVLPLRETKTGANAGKFYYACFKKSAGKTHHFEWAAGSKSSSYVKKVSTAGTKIAAKSFTPSTYQQAFFDAVEHGTGNFVIEAVAGSGKTTSAVAGLALLPSDLVVAYIAFSKHIADELAARVAAHIHASTFHSLGLSNVKSAFRGTKVDTNKVYKIYADYVSRCDFDTKEILKKYASAIQSIVGHLKGALLEPTVENMNHLIDRYNIDIQISHMSLVIKVAQIVFKSSVDDTNSIDFNDMVYMCATGAVACQTFDVIFIDEVQDADKAQVQMMLKSLKPGGRIFGIGDRNQSIFGFRGADVDSIPNLIEATNAKCLPLSICYRCDKAIVELAKTLVPQIEARPNAGEGLVENIAYETFLGKVAQEDMVLCRTNAPLVKPCFALIRKGVKATIKGRDIGAGLKSLIDAMNCDESLIELLETVRLYVDAESFKALKAGRNSRAQTLEDQLDTLLALSDGIATVAELKTRIDTIFSDEESAVTFSSIHRAKGLEAARVFILHHDLLPHPLAKKDFEIQQELNLQYVAYTRAMRELYIVSNDPNER